MQTTDWEHLEGHECFGILVSLVLNEKHLEDEAKLDLIKYLNDHLD